MIPFVYEKPTYMQWLIKSSEIINKYLLITAISRRGMGMEGVKKKFLIFCSTYFCIIRFFFKQGAWIPVLKIPFFNCKENNSP